MVADEGVTDVLTDAEEEELEESVPRKPGRGRKWLIVQGVLIAEAALAFLLITKVILPRVESLPEVEVAKEEVYERHLGPTFSIESLVVNVIDADANRFMKVGIVLELSSGKQMRQMEVSEPLISNAFIDILSSKTVDELLAVGARDKLREEMVGTVNSLLGHDTVVDAFFTEFIIQ